MDKPKNKSDVTNFIGRVFEKGYGWFTKLVNATDHTITKVSIFLREKKIELDEYIVDREKLLKVIHESQVEVNTLQHEIDNINETQTDRLLTLHERLED